MFLSYLKKYIVVVNLILIAALAYVFAQIVNDRIKERISPPLEAAASDSISPGAVYTDQKPNLRSSRSSYDVILDRNIFGLKSTSSAPSNLNPDEVPQTTLNLELLGTVIKPGVEASAIIKNLDNGKIQNYVEGEIVDIITSERVELSRIESCIAVLNRSEGPETIRCKRGNNNFSPNLGTNLLDSGGISDAIRRSLEESGLNKENEGIREVGEGAYEVDRDTLEGLLSDPNQLITQARVIPQEDGLRFFAIRPNSVFSKIGIRNGDTLNRINDVNLDNVENAFRLFEELRGQGSFRVNLTRRGQNLTYQYTVK